MGHPPPFSPFPPAHCHKQHEYYFRRVRGELATSAQILVSLIEADCIAFSATCGTAAVQTRTQSTSKVRVLISYSLSRAPDLRCPLLVPRATRSLNWDVLYIQNTHQISETRYEIKNIQHLINHPYIEDRLPWSHFGYIEVNKIYHCN